jgi:hypothetical protein
MVLDWTTPHQRTKHTRLDDSYVDYLFDDGFGKEVLDQVKRWFGGGGDDYDSGDMRANAKGRQCAKREKSCEEECKGVR